MASVKVAVRVRPFNQRENDLHSTCIVEVEDNKTKLISNKVNSGSDGAERGKDFTFDYSYWSHIESDKHFAPQVKIYEDLGTDVVSNALQGYNACVFAYGQTGSGKTFTMMGSQNNPGLIPRICEALFSSMAEGREAGATYKVEVSYLEIYNERVKDLLRSGAQSDTHSLRVREHPKLGPYVQDLSTHLVHQYPDIQELMRRGNSHRTTASTHMNDTSSRSHAIFTVTFIQAKLQSDTPLETRSKIHLVDLAGSERADATGATGKRLKEGAHINKSLVTLGSVISALAEQAAKTAGKNVFIPYRDSVLTWLLKDSLGGNSKTIMIATISPADVNYGETLSTLRYANRAKNIINKPTINEDPNVKLIRELREQILSLKCMLKESGMVEPEENSETGSIIAALTQKQAKEKELTDQWTEKWSETHTILQEQKTLGLRKAGHGVVLDSDRPHLVVIDDNLLTTGVTLYHLNDGITTIGSLPTQDIILEGGEVLEEHCTIHLTDGEATLEAHSEAQCWVNSQFVDKPSRLTQGCVVVLGGGHMFRFNDPQEAARLRKEGNKTHLNLSRLSFLSRSTTDLVRSFDNLSGMESDSEKLQPDTANVSRLGKMTKLSETADLCEMSTQTSLQTHSQPTTPIGSHREGITSQALRKSSLTLPLLSEKEDSGGGVSCNSTPASDTFYTATSALSPDIRDLTSPWSPMEVPSSVIGRDRESSFGGACASPQGYCDINLKVPNQQVLAEENISHFERDDDLCSSIYKSPNVSQAEIVPTVTNSESVNLKNLNVDQIGDYGADGTSDNLDLHVLPTSPILLMDDRLKPKGSPGVEVAATSTPIKVRNTQSLRSEEYRLIMQGEKNRGKGSSSSSSETNHNEAFGSSSRALCVSNSWDANRKTNVYNVENNANDYFRTSKNGNAFMSKSVDYGTENDNDDGVLKDRMVNLKFLDNGDESSLWHSGLENICKSSMLISPDTEVAKAAEVLIRLRENEDKSDISVEEKIRELEALKQHYSVLEEQLMSQPSVISKRLEKKTGESEASEVQDGGKHSSEFERPTDLPLESSSLLQEDRLALLIEREVQRRVLEEVVARENAAFSSRSQYRRTSRSMSTSVDPWNLGLRVLTPAEVRPYTSMSAGYEIEGEGGNHLYQSTSADDLLLTQGPLRSPLTDYDMSCGICVCIPGYEMRGSGSSSHWEYEIKLVAGPDSWTVFRRYRRFRELHTYMCHKYGRSVDELYFPPRRLFGNFTERVVAERRGQLEVYLQQLIVLCSELEDSPLCGAPPCRATLAHFSPFFQRGVFETSRHTTS